MRVEQKKVDLNTRTMQLLDKQIKILEEDGDPKSVFKEWELKELEDMGHSDYLAMLKRIRVNLGIQDLGE